MIVFILSANLLCLGDSSFSHRFDAFLLLTGFVHTLHLLLKGLLSPLFSSDSSCLIWGGRDCNYSGPLSSWLVLVGFWSKCALVLLLFEFVVLLRLISLVPLVLAHCIESVGCVLALGLLLGDIKSRRHRGSLRS